MNDRPKFAVILQHINLLQHHFHLFQAHTRIVTIELTSISQDSGLRSLPPSEQYGSRQDALDTSCAKAVEILLNEGIGKSCIQRLVLNETINRYEYAELRVP